MTTNNSSATILNSYEDETGQELAALAEAHPTEGADLAETLVEHVTDDGMLRRGQVSSEAIDAAEQALRAAVETKPHECEFHFEALCLSGEVWRCSCGDMDTSR